MVTKELVHLSRKVIVFPSMSALVHVKTAFKAVAGIPNVCGIVDGCFIRIKKNKGKYAGIHVPQKVCCFKHTSKA